MIMEYMDDKLMDERFTHFSYRKVPFEDTITNIYIKKGIAFSDRTDFLHNLYFVTSKGYYFKYQDFKEPTSYCDCQSAFSKPFIKYLDGILDAAWVLAFNSTPEAIIQFILRNLKEGKISCGKCSVGLDAGKYGIDFILPWVSYLAPEDRNN